MGYGHKHWHTFGEEQIITCNVQRGDPSTLTNLVQPLPKLYNLLPKRKQFPNATVLVQHFFFRHQRLRGEGVQKCFPGAKFFSSPPLQRARELQVCDMRISSAMAIEHKHKACEFHAFHTPIRMS